MSELKSFLAWPVVPVNPHAGITSWRFSPKSAPSGQRCARILIPVFIFTALLILAGNKQAYAQLDTNPTSIKFGAVGVGNQSTKTVSLKNAEASSITISQSSVTGNSFNVSGLTLPLTLNPGQKSTFSAIFGPSAAGRVLGTITLTSNASNSPTTVALAGTGTTRLLSVSPTSTNFGNVTLGNNSTLPLLLSNTGSLKVTITQSVVTGTGFSISGLTLPLTLSAGKNTSFNVTFDPTSAGLATGNVSVVSNATNSPANGSLSGVGVNPHTVALSWTSSTSPGVVGYNVFRSQAPGGPYGQLNSSLDSTTTYADAAVSAGQTYYYVTTAVNSSNVQSAYSDQAEAVIPQ